jgi:2'-5' RNA ligase
MAKIAVDVVLLPSAQMTGMAIEANKRLREHDEDRIILSEDGCLPHISLSMGCIDQKDVSAISDVLLAISRHHQSQRLTVTGAHIAQDHAGRSVSAFQVESTGDLQALHEAVMLRMAPFFGPEVTADAVLGPPAAEEPTLLWIRNYRDNSSFENFFPHITVGYGRLDEISGPVEFVASELALCRLGNCCTCRKILVSFRLGGPSLGQEFSRL